MRLEELRSCYTKAYISNSGAFGVVEEGDEIVSGMRDDGAEDTGNVAANNAHPHLK